MHKLIAFAKWCRDLPPAEMAAHLKRTGVDGVDLPVRPTAAAITPDQAPAKLPEAKKIFNDHGLDLTQCVTGITVADDETERNFAAFAECGIQQIRLGSWHVLGDDTPTGVLERGRRDLPKIQKLCEKYGVRAAVQNHSGPYIEANVSGALRLVDGCDPKWIGIQVDPGHLSLAGEPFDFAVDLAGEYMQAVNLKSGRWEYFADRQAGTLKHEKIIVPLRDGLTDIPAVLSKLKRVGYDRPLSIHAEYRTHYLRVEEHVETTTDLVRQDCEYVRSLMAAS
jgi:sugar phosphate isomerase/epimerase